MKLVTSQNRIIELLSRFSAQISHGTSMSKTDLNKAAETVLIPLLNEVYGWKLENINYAEENPNYPGIDLADGDTKVSIQVTATPTLNKVKHTLEQFVKHRQYSKYDRLIIFILKDKQSSYSENAIQQIIQNQFAFDPKQHIWDFDNILKEVSNFQIDKARRVQEILEKNFGEGKRRLIDREVCDKVDRIVSEHEFFVQRPEQEQLDKFLDDFSSGLLLVSAGAGFGKTALLANWMKTLQGKNYFVAYHFFNERDDAICNLSRAYRNLLQQLYP